MEIARGKSLTGQARILRRKIGRLVLTYERQGFYTRQQVDEINSAADTFRHLSEATSFGVDPNPIHYGRVSGSNIATACGQLGMVTLNEPTCPACLDKISEAKEKRRREIDDIMARGISP